MYDIKSNSNSPTEIELRSRFGLILQKLFVSKILYWLFRAEYCGMGWDANI